MMHVNRGAYPQTQHRDEPVGRCRPSCCKTPYGCARNNECGCHRSES